MNKKTYNRKVVSQKYSFMRDLPEKIKKEYASTILSFSKKDNKIIDVGFGTGTFLIPLSKQNKNSKIYGIDASKSMYSIVKDKIDPSKASLSQKGITWLKNQKNNYDILHFKAILHCVTNPEEKLDILADSVKSGGYIITAHEESQSEDRLEQIFNYSSIDNPDLELMFGYYFQLRNDLGKPFISRKYPAGDSKKAADYLIENKGFKLEKEITNKKLSWNRLFTFDDLVNSMRLGTFGVFFDNLTKQEREILYKKMIDFAKMHGINLKTTHTIKACFKIYILKKK
jgi:ubiquinone/menaquinone biosynthesis C-methylase UbiE